MSGQRAWLAVVTAAWATGAAVGQAPPPNPFGDDRRQQQDHDPRGQFQPPGPGQLPAGAEVLARGPVHEAFAEPVDGKLSPTPIVPQPPRRRSTRCRRTSGRPATTSTGWPATGPGTTSGTGTCG